MAPSASVDPIAQPAAFDASQATRQRTGEQRRGKPERELAAAFAGLVSRPA
jgi:hypothetical protein